MTIKASLDCFLLTAAELSPSSIEAEISPVLHTGGKGVHAGSDSTNSKTCLDDWVGMEKHSLDHIQNICVSVQTGIFMLKSTHTKEDNVFRC